MSNKRAFTVIEILVVIAVISVIAGIVAGYDIFFRHKARVATALENFRQIQTAMNLYYSQNSWPEDPGSGFVLCQTEDCASSGGIIPFMPPVTTDYYPSSDATYFCPNCIYKLKLGNVKDNGAGPVDCGSLSIINTDDNSVMVSKNILCAGCPDECNFSCTSNCQTQ